MAETKIIDNIVFNNIKSVGEIVGSAPISFNNSSPGSDTELGGIINAIDIDWNGAQIDDNVTINNTGELLNYIKGAYSSGGDPSQSDFTNDEITALKGLVNKESEDDTQTYIQKLEARIAALEDALKTSSTNSALLNVAAIKENADKVSGNKITKTRLENLVDYGQYTVINDSNIFGSNNATPGKIRTYSAANFVTGSSDYYNDPSKYKEIKVVYTVDGDNGYVVTNINEKLDESAINYDSTSQTLTITK